MTARSPDRERLPSVVMALILLGHAGAVRADAWARAGATATVIVAGRSSITLSNDLVLGPVLLSSTDVEADEPLLSVSSGLTIAPSLSPAGVTIVGDPDQTISVGVPENIDLTRMGGDEHLVIATADLAGIGASPGNHVLNPDGTLLILVGARALVASNAVPGNYRGVLMTMAQYN